MQALAKLGPAMIGPAMIGVALRAVACPERLVAIDFLPEGRGIRFQPTNPRSN